jgi:hypothetical protein
MELPLVSRRVMVEKLGLGREALEIPLVPADLPSKEVECLFSLGGAMNVTRSERRIAQTLLWIGFLFSAGIAAFPARQQAESVKIEKKPTYIPAVRGEKFDVTRHLVPLGEIRGGGPPKDGIPSLDNPAFVSSAAADHQLKGLDGIIGVEFKGIAKAYPIRILNWHEIVNDEVGGRAVLVTW